MIRSRLLLQFSACCLLAGSAAFAATQAAPQASVKAPDQQAPVFRPCAESDLIGTWQMIDLDENPKGNETYIFDSYSKYQYIHFGSDGTYLFAMSNVEYSGEKNITALLNLASKSLGLFYSAQTKGVLVIKDSKTVTDQHSCNIVLRDYAKYRKDQLVLSQGHKKPVPTQITRMYKKIFNQ